jgi:hypothetical protein
MNPRSLGSAAFVLFFLCFALAQSNSPAESKLEHYAATAFPNNSLRVNTRNVISLDLYIDSYSPEDEVQSLVSISKAQGVSGIQKAFSQMGQRGRMAVSLSPSQGDLKFIRSVTDDKGTVIYMATDRILSFDELTGDSASRNYRFSVIELHLDSQGKGQGTLTYAAKLKFDDQGELKVESYDAIPILLGSVRKLK